MPSRLVKLSICALSFAVMAASSAQAAQKVRKPVGPQATAGNTVPCRGANLFTAARSTMGTIISAAIPIRSSA